MSRTFLTKNLQPSVDFDPSNLEHLKAFQMLCLQPVAQQHPTLRFNVDEPHPSVPAMMFHKIADAHIESIVATTKPLVKRVRAANSQCRSMSA